MLSELSDFCLLFTLNEGSEAICTETKQVVIRGNLSLESKHLATRQVAITARVLLEAKKAKRMS